MNLNSCCSQMTNCLWTLRRISATVIGRNKKQRRQANLGRLAVALGRALVKLVTVVAQH